MKWLMAADDTRAADPVDHDCKTMTAWFVVTVSLCSRQ